MKKEATFSIRFRHWLRSRPMIESCVFEMKSTRGKDYFPYAEFKEEQEAWALAIMSKVGTLMRNVGGHGEPDYTYHYNEPAFIVIDYPGGFEIIKMKDFLAERDGSKEKSLSYADAKKISTYSIRYKKE